MSKVATSFLLIVAILGCANQREEKVATEPEDKYVNAIKFHDDPSWQADSGEELSDLQFTTPDGQAVSLKDHLGESNVVLVVTRGIGHEGEYSGDICVYCATQTSRLITNYPKFKDRNTEVLVIFPTDSANSKSDLSLFTKTVKSRMTRPVETAPFPVWLDENLKAVKQLGIEADLSKPSTYILDKSGKVRYAYVGQSLTDRPSVKALTNKLEEINRESAQ